MGLDSLLRKFKLLNSKGISIIYWMVRHILQLAERLVSGHNTPNVLQP